ncbi:MAG TPA: Lrp/AsnC family transcriptional regulator [Myxococcaceae bacterium]|nr:Lrp/AsnC family transcriptional regulator [Myxococcaceae bacterium]
MRKVALDRIEIEIVAALQKNGRISNKELAAQVGLAPSSCHERLRQLMARKVVRGVHADIDPAALGIGLQAMFFVRLKDHSRPSVASFHDRALQLGEVIALYNVTGSEDFLVHVVARDLDHLYQLARDTLTTFGEVDHIQTLLIFEAVRRPELPQLNLLEAPAPRARKTRKRR